MSWLVWCKKCKTEAIEVHPDNVESESSVCWGCYPYYHLDQVNSWREGLGPYHAPEYFGTHYDSFHGREPRPDPVERALASMAKFSEWIDQYIPKPEFNTVDLAELRRHRLWNLYLAR